MTYLKIIKRNSYKYVAIMVLIALVGIGLYKANLTQAMTIRLYIFLGSVLTLLLSAALSWLIFSSVRKRVIMWHHATRKYFRQWRYRATLIIDLNRILRHQYSNHSVEIVFAMFVHFYEQHLQDVEHWALPEEEFPEGKFALTKMYKYIKKTRVDNQKELAGMDFNDKDNTFSFWGEWYGGFNFRVKDDELVVIPNSEITTPEAFFKKRMRIENDLYILDNEKANWIINRRKFLMI